MSLVVGTPVDRSDAILKVTGQANYAADHRPANTAYACPVVSTIARGRVSSIDTAAAMSMPGVIAVLSRDNSPAIKRTQNDFGTWTKLGEPRVLFEDDQVHYVGQYLAVVVARTMEQATEAAAHVRVEYQEETPVLDTAAARSSALSPQVEFGEKLQNRRLEPEQALAASKFRIEATYTTPVEHHNPMEPMAVVSEWNDDDLTQHDATQWVMGARNCVADMLAIPRENVHIVSRFVGGGFGCKGFTWPHQAMAPVAARATGMAVKLPISRKQMFTACGHRPETRQDVELGCDEDGKITGLRHKSTTHTSIVDDYVERCGALSPWLYDVPNLEVTHELVRVNIATPTPMRAPGETPGSFALESALDELAFRAGIDPLEFRLRNYSEIDAHKNKPYSSKQLRECYRQGAERFGWSLRSKQPRGMRDGNWLVGYGVGTATYPGYRFFGAAKVRVEEDGTVVVSSATQDIGTGTYTTMRQIAADALGIGIDRVSSELGDSRLPPAPVSGGSMTTASLMPAVHDAATEVLTKMKEAAVKDPANPFHEADPETLDFASGKLGRKDGTGPRLNFSEILKSSKLARLEAEANRQPGAEQGRFSFHSFGAHFIEVRVDPDLGIVRVPRVVSVFDVGRVINGKTARSQMLGGITQGIGMALMEHSVYDRRNGRPVTDSLADYLIPVNADIGNIDVTFLNIPDPHINALGARGIGEIGITGVAGAIANAVFNATGKRIRDLPITPEKLLEP